MTTNTKYRNYFLKVRASIPMLSLDWCSAGFALMPFSCANNWEIFLMIIDVYLQVSNKNASCSLITTAPRLLMQLDNQAVHFYIT